MKLKIFLALLGSFLFIQSCATVPTPDITSAPSPDQKRGYDGTLFSRKKHWVSLSPYTELDDAIPEIGFAKTKTKFMLTIKNGGENPVRIGTDGISVVVQDAGKDSMYREIRVQSLDDFMVDFEQEYNEDEKNFVYSTLHKYYDLWKSNKNPDFAGWIADKMWDFRDDLRAMRIQKYRLQETLPKAVLTDQTILPGRSYTGIVICDTRELDPETTVTFSVTVSVDGEQHLFTFNRRPS